MNNEELKAVVEVEIDDSEAINQAERTQKTLEEVLKDLNIGIDFQDKASVETGLQKIKAEMHKLETADRLGLYNMGISDEERWNRFDDYEKAAIKLEDILSKFKDEEPMEEMPKTTSSWLSKLKSVQTTVVDIGMDAKNLFERAKRFTLSLIGIQGLYSGIRKAMGVWLSQNDDLQKKLNACWYALGSLFAPVLEWLVNMFVKLVSIVDYFVKLLGFAGINMDKYGKSAGKASKQLAGFDEINNINDNGGDGFSNPFGNFDLADKFGEFASLIKGNADLLKLIGIGAMFGIGVALLFTGHPLSGLGMILAAGVLTYKEIAPNWDYLTEKVGGVKNAVLGILAGFAIGLGAVLTFTGHPALGLGLLISGIAAASFAVDWSYLPNNLLQTVSNIMLILGVSMTAIGFILLFFPATCAMGLALLVAGLGIGYAGYTLNTKFLSDKTAETLNNVQGEIDDKAPKIESSMSTSWGNMEYDTTKKWGNIGDVIGENLDGIRTATGSKTGSIWSIFSVFDSNLDRDTTKTWGSIVSTIITKFGDIKEKLKKKWESLESWWSSLSLGSFNIKLPHLSWGTNSFGIPKLNVDWYANGGVFSGPQIIGVGEYSGASTNPEVVAPLETLQGYMDSEETNDLLRELIDVVGSKEFRAYISQREIGEASLNYQRSKQRIMGGGLV